MKLKKGTWQPPPDAWNANRVCQLRRSLNWSQVTLARKIGSTVQTVSNWERGAAIPGHRYTRALLALSKKAPTTAP